MYAACFLAFSTGFLSLSLEILWIRLFAFANQSLPQAFAFVLAVYLVGIALGASVGKWFCKQSYDLWLVCGLVLIVSSVCDLTGPWLYADWIYAPHQLIVAGAVILMTSLLKAIAFPIAHHLGAPTFAENVGHNISRVYVSNIIGATLGPIFTGLILLRWMTTQQSFILCAELTFLVAMYCLTTLVRPMVVWVSTLAILLQYSALFLFDGHELISRVAFPYGKMLHMVENQYGIVAAYNGGGKDGDVIAGNNAYDGMTNLDPVLNSNHINRVVVLSTLVEQPSRVLVIGLSIGSWLKIVTSFPGVDVIDVVEINPGYLELMQNYPPQVVALLDPRVHLYIDDGRRWLKAHPQNKYDMVIMNTTYHWRAYSTNLLSIEFLRIIKKHMNENAVLAYNSTNSPDVLKTASVVFSHAYMYENFVIAANFDWRDKMRSFEALNRVAGLMLDGKHLYPAGSEALILRYLNYPLVSLETIEPYYNGLGREVEVITDRNVITEYKYGEVL